MLGQVTIPGYVRWRPDYAAVNGRASVRSLGAAGFNGS